LVTLLLVSTAVFSAVRASGDPIVMLAGDNATPEDIQRLRGQYGLAEPLPIQYVIFIRSLLVGDFGDSIRQSQPALGLVLDRVPATVQLASASILLAILVALPVGVLAAIRRNSSWDRIIMAFALVGQSAPTFWIGLMLILIVSVQLGLLPTGGEGDWRNLILPTITLASWSMAAIARLVRSAMLDVLREDYLRTARAKGLKETVVITRHALRNAAIPVITMIGLQMGALFGGSVVTETVFAWPGIGRLALQSIYWRDYPVVQAVVFLVAVSFVFINLMVDVVYTWLDPRIRYD
jgi:ABC-type dipeptide/oligopeptide/nickel transport system permease component